MRIRLSAVVGVMGLGLLTAGCETSDIVDKMHDLNPFGTAKTPLPGERRAVFPEGVPGVQQGVPPELMRGAPRQAALEPEPLDPTPQREAPKQTDKPKPKPRPRVAQPRPQRPAPPPETVEQQAPARPRPAAAQPAPTNPAAPAPAAAPWTPPPQQAPPMTVWPDPPKPGTFSR